jgi:transitional endoplasmic reticulum ATPase
MTKSNPILSKGQTIDNKYSVSFFLKKGSYAETYRVQNEAKETKILKL